MNTTKNKRHKINYTIKLSSELDPFLKTLKKINFNLDEMQIIYENEIWDGPLEALCLWEGEKYYFINIPGFDIAESPRKYFLLRLSDDQLRNDEALRAAYVLYIQSKPLVEKGKIGDAAVFDREGAEWDKYFEECKKYPDQIIGQDQIVGWFEW